MTATDTDTAPAAITAPEPDRRRYVCPRCGKRRKIRENHLWHEFNAYVSVTDDRVHCWSCANRGAEFVRLERCELCGSGKLRNFYIDREGLIHREYRCAMGEAVTSPLKGTIRIHIPVLRESVTGLPIRGPVSKLSDKAAVTPPSVTDPGDVMPRKPPVRERPPAPPVTTRTDTDMRDCEKCGEPFYPARSDARFCSTKCRVAAHRAKRNGD